MSLLETGENTVPPPDVALRELRSLLKVTQTELAERMGVGQAAVSKLERRPDMTVGTLQRFVAALGGELEIRVRVSDEVVRITGIGASEEPARACCDHVRSRLQGQARSPVAEADEELKTRLELFVQTVEEEVRRRLPSANWTALTGVSLSGDPVASLAEGRLQVSPSAASSLAAKLLCLEEPATEAQWHICRLLALHELGHRYGPSFQERFSDLQKVTDLELLADTFAGWLDSLQGGSPVIGLSAFRAMGCRQSDCQYPSSEARAAAYLEGTRLPKTSQKRLLPRMNLLVLRATDVERSRTFYEGIGFNLRKERHGKGPLHYSCDSGSGVFEIYPCRRGTESVGDLRLGFVVPDAQGIFQELEERGFEPCPKYEDRLNSPSVWVLRDPDGNAIEIQELSPEVGQEWTPHALATNQKGAGALLRRPQVLLGSPPS
ncbi:MAG: XRE family transcriptional regulator [Planctomycetes bacterium]|nr:XRE family transcriptional regulator [Planctomycetota bacterium]